MKLKSLLSLLRKDEYKSFEKFLQSPFFKESEQYLRFFRYMTKQYPSFEFEKPDLEGVFKKCFGKGEYAEGKLYNLMSGMSRQLEIFFAVRQVLANEKELNHLGQYLLVKSLGQRSGGEYFKSEAEQLIESLEGAQVKSTEDALVLSELNAQIYFNPQTQKYLPDSHYLKQAIHKLDEYYFTLKLRLAAESLSRKTIFQTQHELLLINELLETVSNLNENEGINFLPKIYARLVGMYLNGIDAEGFRSLKNVLGQYFKLLSKDDNQFLFQHIINIGVKLMAQNQDLEREILEIYKMVIHVGLILENNQITYAAYINIATLAALNLDVEWGWDFIVKYGQYIEENKRTIAINLASANLAYVEGKLDKAQSFLTAETYYLLPGYDVVARGLLLKIIFDRYLKEGRDYEFLVSHISAYERFVAFKQLSEEKKLAQLNYIKFVKKMTLTKFEAVHVDKQKKISLSENLKELLPIVSKKWLESRIDLL